MRIYCTVCAINSQRAVQPVNIFETIVSQAHFAICLRENFSRVETFCGIDQCSSSAALGMGEEHTELCFNHVTVFSQSVTRIRLSHIT